MWSCLEIKSISFFLFKSQLFFSVLGRNSVVDRNKPENLYMKLVSVSVSLLGCVSLFSIAFWMFISFKGFTKYISVNYNHLISSYNQFSIITCFGFVLAIDQFKQASLWIFSCCVACYMCVRAWVCAFYAEFYQYKYLFHISLKHCIHNICRSSVTIFSCINYAMRIIIVLASLTLPPPNITNIWRLKQVHNYFKIG